MENKQYLNEERYQKNKNKLIRVAIFVIILGLLIGGTLIFIGLNKMGENSVDELQIKIAAEEAKILAKKAELEAKGIKYDSWAKYTDGEVYDYKVIIDVLDPSREYFHTSAGKNNPITKEYCTLKEKQQDAESGFANARLVPLCVFGAFAIIASMMMGGSIYATAKRREIQAFTTQQSMPIEQEKIEAMTPTHAAAAKEIAKAVVEGIKEGKE